MKNKYLRAGGGRRVICAVIFLVLFGSRGAGAAESPIQVVTSIAPLKGLIDAIGQDRVRVTVMVPSSADPHTYEPKPSVMKKLEDADLYVRLGSGIEFESVWVKRSLEASDGKRVVEASRGISLVDKDPHVWVSVPNLQIMADNIVRGLSEADPANRDFYEAGAKRLKTELSDLDRYIRQGIQRAGVKALVVEHPEWSYFCREYGLKEWSIEKEGGETTPSYLARMIAEARSAGARHVLASPQRGNALAQSVAAQLEAKLIRVDALSEDLPGQMRTLIELLYNNSST